MNGLNLDLGWLAGVVSTLTILAGAAVGMARWLKKCMENTIKAQISPIESSVSSQVAAIENRMAKQTEAIESNVAAQILPLDERLKKQESWTRKQQDDIDAAREYNVVITRGVSACLKGLKEQGCNGPVTEAIEEMDDFLVTQANKGRSKQQVVNKH